MIRVLLVLFALSAVGMVVVYNPGTVLVNVYVAQVPIMLGALIGGIFALGFAAGAAFLSLFKHGTSPTPRATAAPSFAYRNPSDPKGRAPASTSREIQYE